MPVRSWASSQSEEAVEPEVACSSHLFADPPVCMTLMTGCLGMLPSCSELLTLPKSVTGVWVLPTLRATTLVTPMTLLLRFGLFKSTETTLQSINEEVWDEILVTLHNKAAPVFVGGSHTAVLLIAGLHRDSVGSLLKGY